MYAIEYSRRAGRFIRKLDRDGADRILSGIERIRVRPKRFCRRLVGSPYYRLRIGDYRAILDIKEGELVVLVLEIVHRSRAYRD